MESTKRRRRVLIGAYACGPGMGSEPGAGWAMVVAAADHADVWVITRHRFAPAIQQVLLNDPVLAKRIRVEYVDLSRRQLRRKRRHRDVYWYYPLWQRKLSQTAVKLHGSIGFDVMHHVTFAVDWMPSGLNTLASEVPLVWGPVGGSTYVPARLMPWLGIRGAIHEISRSVVTRTLRRLVTVRLARRSALIVALNRDVQKRFVRYGPVVIEPNAVIEHWDDTQPKTIHEGAKPYTAVFVGRLVAWKGVRLAVAAMSHPEASAWTLEFIGSGPEASWIKNQVKRMGLEDSVLLHGQLSRDEVHTALNRADAFLFPSLHDSAPWAVAEAAAVGLPVVCIDLGGPPEMAGEYGCVAAPKGQVAQALARGLKLQESMKRPNCSTRWAPDRFPALVQQWYDSATGTATTTLENSIDGLGIHHE